MDAQLTSKRHPEQAYRICLGLLNLSRAYPPERLEAACRIANKAGLIRLKQVRSILQSNRDQLPDQLELQTELPQDHENIRGPKPSINHGEHRMTTQTLTALRQLKLGGMANALQSQLEQVGTYEGLAFTERLALLVEQETLIREQRKQERLIRQARFKLAACVADIDYQHRRNITASQIARLAQSDWINRGQNLLITGPCGSGKTYLACALGQNACVHGYSVRYYRLSRLLLQLTQAKADGTYHKHLKQLAKIRLLLIDDWGLENCHRRTETTCWKSWTTARADIHTGHESTANGSMVCQHW